jgi:methane/ammonia monooxygenase subunit C
MSTLIGNNRAYAGAARHAETAQSREGPPQVPWMLALAVGLTAVLAVAGIKWYQHAYSWTVGLDAWAPQFQSWWMSIFYTQIIVLPLIGAVAAAALWFTRDRNIQDLPPQQELKRFYGMFAVLTAAGILVATSAGLLVEADAAWHQVVIRDTDFTPTHIFLFYLAIPAVMVGLVLGWIWVHTRLPYFATRVSWPLSIAMLGFFMAGPVVAFNEWAHTFFYAEELFGAPVHWGFVVAIFFLVFLGGFVLQCLQRMRQLTEKLSLAEVEEEIKA